VNYVLPQDKCDILAYAGTLEQQVLAIPDLDFIVTRNTKDFKKSTLAVFTPAEALASFSIV